MEKEIYQIEILKINEKQYVNKETGEMYPYIESYIELNNKKFILLPLTKDKELYKYLVKELYKTGVKEIALVCAEEKIYTNKDTGESYPYYQSYVVINDRKFILLPLTKDKELYKYFVKEICNNNKGE